MKKTYCLGNYNKLKKDEGSIFISGAILLILLLAFLTSVLSLSYKEYGKTKDVILEFVGKNNETNWSDFVNVTYFTYVSRNSENKWTNRHLSRKDY